MNVKSMIVGLVIAMVASTGTYFFAGAKWCRSVELRDAVSDKKILENCSFPSGGREFNYRDPIC